MGRKAPILKLGSPYMDDRSGFPATVENVRQEWNRVAGLMGALEIRQPQRLL